jgi:hypothetical protein
VEETAFDSRADERASNPPARAITAHHTIRDGRVGVFLMAQVR